LFGQSKIWQFYTTANLSIYRIILYQIAPQDLDHLEVERVLYRTTITGDVPVGVDGFRSQVVEGEAFSSELPTILKNKAEKLEAEPVLS